MLPSAVMSEATTFDLYVLDLATRYTNYQHEIAEGKIAKKEHRLSEKEMLDMIKRARGEQ